MLIRKALVMFIIFASFSFLAANGGLFGWKGVYGSVFKLNVGTQSVDLSSLNDGISFNFESSYPESFATIGMQYLYLNDNLMIGVEGKYLANGTHKSSDYTNQTGKSFQTSGIAGFFDLGYVIHTNRYTFIAPWVGIGMGSINFSMADFSMLNEDENTWNNVLYMGYGDVFSASSTTMMMNWGICFDFIFTSWSIGANAGYMHPIGEANWQLAGETIEEGPESYLTGAYFNISFGYTQLNLWSSKVN